MSFKVDIHIENGKKEKVFSLAFKAFFETGKTNILYGNSGSGKTSVLRAIAGLETPKSGTIVLNEVTWFDSKMQVNKKVQERPVGMLFQEANLFPNMTVKANLEYALNGPITKEITALITSCGLTKVMEVMPATISGGEMQRISLIRSLCQKPEVLLLDEPFSALDDQAINSLINALRFIQEAHKTTIIISTHRKEIGKRIGDCEFEI